MSTLLVFQRQDKKWAWHLTAYNGKIIATDGNQGYENYQEAVAMSDAIVINGAYKDADRKTRKLA